jgi:hypothetical protein
MHIYICNGEGTQHVLLMKVTGSETLNIQKKYIYIHIYIHIYVWRVLRVKVTGSEIHLI